MHFRSLLYSCSLFLGLTLSLLGTLPASGQISFSKGVLNLNGFQVSSTTSLQFGPDFRLYVAERFGRIKILEVQRNGLANFEVISVENLDQVQLIPNHFDNGSPAGPTTRQVTGLVVVGTPDQPVIYVTSSDPRGGGGSSKGDIDLDTNSGILTRLSWIGADRDDPEGYWEAVDMVRGLPRSEENHSPNGLQHTEIGGKPFLLMTIGGFTNAGGPSNNFAYTTEYALAGAILAVDLEALEADWPPWYDTRVNRLVMYDLPTLDDPSRQNITNSHPDFPYPPGHPHFEAAIDLSDPFGGNDGLNQAKLLDNGPVRMFAPGFRNCYDLVVTEHGAVFATENGANGGWGGYPQNEGQPELVNNNYRPGEPGSSVFDTENNEPPVNNVDHLHRITPDVEQYAFGSFYAGHPNPVRANPAGAGMFTRGLHTRDPGDENGNSFTDDWFRTLPFDPLASGEAADPFQALPADWPPVSTANPVEADYRNPGETNPDGPDDLIFLTWLNNTNGIDEYTASNFDGALRGNLFAGRSGGKLHRVILDTLSGDLLGLEQDFFSNLGGNPLGIACQGDEEAFAGTIWIATFNDAIVVLEPNDFFDCTAPGDPNYDPTGDDDQDGYTNQDERDNGTDPCNGASQPDDFDRDLLSDLNDPDDDNDGLLDAEDPFQLGEPFNLPVANELFSDNPDLGGYLGTGLTGLMNNGDPNPNYLDWLDDPSVDPRDIYGGAAGALTIYQLPGDAMDAQGGQRKAFQYGVRVDRNTGPFTVIGRMLPPFHPHSATEYQGFFIGDGFQDDYLRILLSNNGNQRSIRLSGERAGDPLPERETPILFPQAVESITLGFRVDPLSGTVQALYGINVTQPAELTALGDPLPASGKLLQAIQDAGFPLAVGIIGRADQPDSYAATFDYLAVQASAPRLTHPIPDLLRSACDPATETIVLDSYFDDDNGTENLSYAVVSNANAAFSISVAGNSLSLGLPEPDAETEIVLRATDQEGFSVLDTFKVRVATTFGPEGAPRARIQVLTGLTDIDASTFRQGAFAIVNASESEDITSLTIDLSTGFFPAMAFDPDGTAGDVDAKGFEVDAGGGAGPFTHTFSKPFGNGGYQALTINFGDFNPGERVAFSVDVDPTSIEGAPGPGPGASGSVSGLELSGATTRVTFSDASEELATLFGDGSPAGSTASVRTELPAAPTLSVVGLQAPAVTAVTQHNLVISNATPNSTLSLLQVEGAYFEPDAPVRPPMPFEVNTALNVTKQVGIAVDNSGSASVEVNLRRTDASGGYNYFLVVEESGCEFGLASSELVLLFDPASGVNNPPVLDPIPDVNVLAGEVVELPLRALDSEGDDLSLSITLTNTITNQQVPEGDYTLTDDGQGNGTFTWVTDQEDVGDYRATVTAYDGANFSSEVFLIAVNSVDAQDGLNINAGSSSGYVNQQGELFLSDRFFAPPKAKSYSTGAQILNTADDPLFRSERYGGSSILQPLRYAVPVANGEYVVQLYFAEVFFDEPGKRRFTVDLEERSVLTDYDIWATAKLVSGSGSGQHFALVESFPVTIEDGAINLDFFAGSGGADNAKVSAISVRRADAPGNLPPVVSAPFNPVHNEGETVSLGLEARDDPAQTLTFLAADLPPGLSINPSNGVISGTVAVGAFEGSPYRVRVAVRDDGLPSMHRIIAFNWTILPEGSNLPPVIEEVGAQSVRENETLNLDFAASDPEGEPLSWQLSLLDPMGILVDPSSYSFLDQGDGTAVFSWTPGSGSEGEYQASLQVSDGSATATSTFSITVLPPDANSVPVIEPIANQSVQANNLLQVLVTASDAENDPISLDLSIRAVSSGEELADNAYQFTDQGNGQGSLSWTPDNTQVGQYEAVVTASDPFGTSQASFSIEVLATVDPANILCLSAAAGNSYTASDGRIFRADAYFSPSKTARYPAAEILNSTDDVIYRGERYANSFSYAVPLQENGTYVVELYFAELFHRQADQRKFSVLLEGQQVLTNYDIWAAASAANNDQSGSNRAVVESFQVAVTDNVLDLRLFLGPEGEDKAKLSALCIRPAGDGGGVNSPPTIAPVADQEISEGQVLTVSDILLSDPDGDALAASLLIEGAAPDAYTFIETEAGNYTLTWPTVAGDAGTYRAVISASDGEVTVTRDFSILVLPSGQEQEALCLNAAAAKDYLASDGRLFQADAYFSRSRTAGYPGRDIDLTEDDPIFLSERYANSFTYQIPLERPGTYALDLFFAELFHKQAGRRVFSVAVEGEVVLSDFDIWAEANAANGGAGGTDVALLRTFTVDVADQTLDIRFFLGANGVDKAKISALCVRPLDGDTPNQAPRIDPIADQTIIEGETLTLSGIQASDPDDDPLTVSLDIAGIPASAYSFQQEADGSYSLTWPTAEGEAGIYEATVRATDGELATEATFAIEVQSATVTSSLCIDVGATSDYLAPNGDLFIADTYFVSTRNRTYRDRTPIGGTEADRLFHTERYGGSNNSNPPFSYAIPVDNGAYQVELYFAELVMTGPDQRRFNVDIEGATVLSAYDTWAAAQALHGTDGAQFAVTEQFAVEVQDGVLDIDFYLPVNGLDNAHVAGICVRSESGSVLTFSNTQADPLRTHAAKREPLTDQGRLETPSPSERALRDGSWSENALRLRAAPNPFRDWTVLECFLPEGGPVRLDFFSLEGRLIHSIESDMLRGWNRLRLDREALGAAQGLVLVRLINGQSVQSLRLIAR